MYNFYVAASWMAWARGRGGPKKGWRDCDIGRHLSAAGEDKECAWEDGIGFARERLEISVIWMRKNAAWVEFLC